MAALATRPDLSRQPDSTLQRLLSETIKCAPVCTSSSRMQGAAASTPAGLKCVPSPPLYTECSSSACARIARTASLAAHVRLQLAQMAEYKGPKRFASTGPSFSARLHGELRLEVAWTAENTGSKIFDCAAATVISAEDEHEAERVASGAPSAAGPTSEALRDHREDSEKVKDADAMVSSRRQNGTTMRRCNDRAARRQERSLHRAKRCRQTKMQRHDGLPLRTPVMQQQTHDQQTPPSGRDVRKKTQTQAQKKPANPAERTRGREKNQTSHA